MAAELIKKEKPLYEKYEEVLLRRDNLRKEAEQYHLEFIKIFGDMITESFRIKIECIKKKKMITYCQKMMNIGKDVNQNDLTRFIEKEMAEYQEELERIIEDVNTARRAKKVSTMDIHKIKKLYYELAKLIHPDMHPEFADDEMLKEYWARISRSYEYNDLEELQELSALVRMYLEGKEPNSIGIEIEDIEGRITKVENEIEEILASEPYLYKLLLNDKKSVEEKKQEYRDELEAYLKYSTELDEILSSFDIKEGMLS